MGKPKISIDEEQVVVCLGDKKNTVVIVYLDEKPRGGNRVALRDDKDGMDSRVLKAGHAPGTAYTTDPNVKMPDIEKGKS